MDRKKQLLAVKAQIDGQSLNTTIDSKLQKSIYEQYKKDKSAHVAMNPTTGEVESIGKHAFL